MNQHLSTQTETGFKNRSLVFGVTLAMAAMLAITAIGGIGTASADTGKAALVIDDLGCRLLDGNGKLAWASKGRAVITHSENGNRVLKCSRRAWTTSPARRLISIR